MKQFDLQCRHKNLLNYYIFNIDGVAVVFSILISIMISVIITRWLFRIDHIVKVLEQSANNLQQIKKQNNILINQQDEIIQLLASDEKNL